MGTWLACTKTVAQKSIFLNFSKTYIMINSKLLAQCTCHNMGLAFIDIWFVQLTTLKRHLFSTWCLLSKPLFLSFLEKPKKFWNTLFWFHYGANGKRQSILDRKLFHSFKSKPELVFDSVDDVIIRLCSSSNCYQRVYGGQSLCQMPSQ